MRATARFHPDQARFKIRKEHGNVLALELLAKQHLAPLIHAMHLKHRLCQIDPNYRNLHTDAPSQLSGRFAPPLWHLDAV
jgi:hypothetical protein